MDKVKNKTTSEIELTNTRNISDVEVNGKHEQNEETSGNVFEWIIAKLSLLRSLITVEPYLICYVIPLTIMSITIQQFNLEKACRSDLNYTKGQCDELVYGINDTDSSVDSVFNKSVAESAMETAVVSISNWREPLTKFVPAILMLNIGAWSDRTGNRKILMLVPVFGELLNSIFALLATYYFTDWPLWIIGVVDGMVGTLTGGIAVALSGVFSYLADVTDLKTRTMRMGMAASISTLGIPVGTALGGVLTNTIGYYGVFSLTTILYLFAFCYTLLKIKDVNRVKEEGSFKEKILNFIHPRNFWATFSLLFLSKGKLLAQILLIMSSYIIIMGPIQGENAQLYLYMRQRYESSIEEFSLFNTVSILLAAAGTTIAVTVFSNMLKLHDTILGFIATLSKVSSTLLFAYAPTMTWMYVAAVFDMLGNSGVTAIKSLISKVVSPENIGKMMSIIAVLDALIPIVAVPMYGVLFQHTLDTFPGAIYYLGAVLTIPDLFIFAALYLINKRGERDAVKNPTAKEAHAYENEVSRDVTSF